jgi:broad specificity phosphatase PhoE
MDHRNIQFILFCGGNNLSTDWKRVQDRDSDLIDRLEQIGDVYQYDPPFYFNDQILRDFKNANAQRLFTDSDLDLVRHVNQVYQGIERYNKQANKTYQRQIIITWSRGHMYGNIICSLYPDQIMGYINIDGGKPDEEYEELLSDPISDSLDQIFKEIKQSDDDETKIKDLRRRLSRYVMLNQFSQYKKTKVKFDPRIQHHILNNIYNDSEINIMDPMYVTHGLKWKIDYNEYAAKNLNAKSTWYCGKKHWLHTFTEVVADIMELIDQMIDRCSEEEKHIYVMRHGETEWNRMGLAQGSENDIELNENGISQAKIFAQYLKDSQRDGFDLIVSSPMIRAKQTAQTIAQIIDYKGPVIYSNDLVESGLGLLATGKTNKELQADPFYDDFFKSMEQWNQMDSLEQLEAKDQIPEIFFTKYNMETDQSIRQRIQRFIMFLRVSVAKKILVVTHADTIRSMNSMILNTVCEIKGDLSRGKNCHLTYYKLKDGRFKLIMGPSTFYVK